MTTKAKAKPEAAKKPRRPKRRGWPAESIEARRVDALVPHARNARTHTPVQVKQIAASIEEWGWTNPLLVDEDDVIIAGHGRILAAEHLGIEEVPVVVARGWSPAQKRAYVIADNKLALEAGWDQSLLSLEFGELRQLDFDLELTGFSGTDVDLLLADPVPPPDFQEVGEDLPTNLECPKCGFKWSAGAK